jgi:hypothetical protein
MISAYRLICESGFLFVVKLIFRLTNLMVYGELVFIGNYYSSANIVYRLIRCIPSLPLLSNRLYHARCSLHES